MYPVRQRGLMHGYRYFIAGDYLFYYSVATTEIRIAAIIPAAMRFSLSYRSNLRQARPK